MKIKAKLISLIGAASVVALSVGCNTVSVTAQQSIAAPVFPPTAPASVQILQTPPVAPNVRLGEITLQPEGNPTTEMIRSKLQTAAAAWGANAVVIVADRQQVLGAYVTGPWWGRQVEQVTGRVIVGVAIRYVQ
jgi:hypothetical protein